MISLIAACCLSGCKAKDVSVTSAPKTPAAAASKRGLSWTLPAGWREEAGEGMRFATLLAGPVGQAYEVSVIRLDGEAGGALANVNRWRGQLGLPPIDAAGLDKTTRRLETPAGPALFVDLSGRADSGAPQRMLVAMLPQGASTWFFKMVAPGPALKRYAPGFKLLLASLRPSA
ncbi:MAG: hypothetical protein KGO96_03795 [Elusimicrobia bacterium]|nr:hypothetical protein [Elusimicrobiota bacterium]MDE2425016.1 hypothetical protein [Elusimicrobiota bacterium]